MTTSFRHLYRLIIRFWGFLESHFHLLSLKGAGEDFFKSRRQFHISQYKQGLCVTFLMCSVSTGCMTDATVDLTKAPFDASTELTDASTDSITRLTDGTSQATTDLTEPTREFLSSTTPGAWFRANGTLNPDYKTIAFIVLNFDNLQEGMAQGSGEYLVSLATLAGVSPSSREHFLTSAQSHYGYIFEERQSRPESLRRLIKTLHLTPSSS